MHQPFPYNEAGKTAWLDTHTRLLCTLIQREGTGGKEVEALAVHICRQTGNDPYTKYPVMTQTTFSDPVGEGPVAQASSAFEFRWQRLVAHVAASLA